MEVLTRPPENGRGCGYRDEEMPYLCTGLSKQGMPLEHFLMDPALPWDDVWQRGFALLQKADGTCHVLIFVSAETYPSPWDFFIEAKHYGVSRKVHKEFPFHLLTPGSSRMFFAHRRAIPLFEYKMKAPVFNKGQAEYMTRLHGCKWQPNSEMVLADKIPAEQASKYWPLCETRTGYHPPGKENCTMALKDLAYIVHSDKQQGYELTIIGERFSVAGPSFSYAGAIPSKPKRADWGAGIFLSTPLTHIEFANKADEESANSAKLAGYDVKIVPW